MRVLVLIVAYRNHAEVVTFAEAVSASAALGDTVVAVCDNSPAGWPADVRRPDGVLIVARPDNPGYLPGAVSAWRKATRAAGYGNVDWVVVCNTDLELAAGDVDEVLGEYDPTRVVVIGPRVVDLPAGVDATPSWCSDRRSGRSCGVSRCTRFRWPAGPTCSSPYGGVVAPARPPGVHPSPGPSGRCVCGLPTAHA